MPHDHIGGHLTIKGETKILGPLEVTEDPLCLSSVIDVGAGHVTAEMIDCGGYVRACAVGTIKELLNHLREWEEFCVELVT